MALLPDQIVSRTCHDLGKKEQFGGILCALHQLLKAIEQTTDVAVSGKVERS